MSGVKSNIYNIESNIYKIQYKFIYTGIVHACLHYKSYSGLVKLWLMKEFDNLLVLTTGSEYFLFFLRSYLELLSAFGTKSYYLGSRI